MIEQQELYCHNCGRYVQFELDITVNGNYVLDCPNCGHEHCRVVNDGVITDTRWDSRNGPLNNFPVINLMASGTTSTSNFTTYTASATANVSYDSWTWGSASA